jgi:hypothetical protein
MAQIKKSSVTRKLSTVNPLLGAMTNNTNVAQTSNGAASLASSLSKTVDFFAKGAALRAATEANVVAAFAAAFAEDRLTAVKTIFYFRDVRNGQGERQTFLRILKYLGNNYPDVARLNLKLIPEFGRWDDLYAFDGTPVEADAYALFAEQIKQDVANLNEGKPISLLAKWLKSINTSSHESRRLGYKTMKAFGVTPKQYRQALAKLRAKIDVIEVKLAGKRFDEIKYDAVPSRASLLYRKAFNKRDGARYRAYLGKVEKGEAKINATVLYPYDIIKPIEVGRETDPTSLRTLDLQWKNQTDWLAGNPHKGLVVCDTSGSMHGQPILVSVSLAIYFAERNVGPFQDHFITFSNSPTLQRIYGESIAEKVRGLNRNGWDMNTDLQAVFNLILNTAVSNRVKQKDMVDVLYIVSDMQFDAAMGSRQVTNFEVIRQKYAAAGYVMPKLVFWNVNATGGDSPVKYDQNGTALVSGCSPSILKSVLSSKQFTPIDIMLETLNHPRYSGIRVA